MTTVGGYILVGRCQLQRQGSSNLLRACPIHPAASMAGIPPRVAMTAASTLLAGSTG
jgi:hypothetical protein